VPRFSPQQNRRILGLALALAVVAVYAPVGRFEFVLFDDQAYVYENPHITSGLTWDGIAWVFTQNHGGNWHPLTGLSHMLDCELFGVNAGGHHLSSVTVHALNSALLYLILANLTGAAGRSLLVAVIFALHPLRVESVAWVSERKDVLSGLLWILTIAAYARYVKRPGRGAYWITLGVFILALMSKPMVVTLPVILLLLDFWPFRRWTFDGSTAQDKFRALTRLLVEKIPFLLCSVAAGVVTLCIQGPYAKTLAQIPFLLRIENVVVSYWRYIGKLFWPTKLAFLYPYPDAVPWWEAANAAAGLILVTVLAILAARRWPYLFVGWFWYLVTLVPVIGLIQVGRQSLADRYTYLPQIGLLILIAWGTNDLLSRRPVSRAIVTAAGVACACVLGGLTRHQLGFWRNSATLFERALQVTEKNSLAHHNLGCALLKQGKSDDAIAHFRKAIEYEPRYDEAHYNLAMALRLQGKLEEALPHYAEAVRLAPRSAPWRDEYGLVLARLGRESEAIAQFTDALRIDPNFAEAHNDLGVALANQGKLDDAIRHFTKAVQAKPDYQEAKDNLQRALTSRSQQKTP